MIYAERRSVGSGSTWILMFHKRSLQLGGDCNGFIYKATPSPTNLFSAFLSLPLLLDFSHFLWHFHTLQLAAHALKTKKIGLGSRGGMGNVETKGWALSGANMEMQFEW